MDSSEKKYIFVDNHISIRIRYLYVSNTYRWNTMRIRTLLAQNDYTFSLSAITSSSTNVGVQLGWQYTNGTNVSQPFNLNGETYNTTITEYWSNDSTEHNYNITAIGNVGNNYVFYANVVSSCVNEITAVNINSSLPAVNLANCFNCGYQESDSGSSNLVSIETNGLNITDANNVLHYCGNLTNIDTLAKWNTSNLTRIGNFLSRCFNITDLTPLAKWNVSKVTDMGDAFSYMTDLETLEGLENWDISNVTSLCGLFSTDYYLTNISALANWNTSKVTDMSWMFYSTFCLSNIGAIANWDVSNVTDLSHSFHYLRYSNTPSNLVGSNITTLDALANWNTSNVTNMAYTFSLCTNLTSLDGIANWDVSNVTNMAYTFNCCTNLTSLDGIANWNVSNVTNMANTFNNCSNLTSLDGIANWNVSNVTNMANTFNNCFNAKTHGFNNWTGASASCANMFRYCNSLEDIQIHWNITCAANMFANRNTTLNVYASTSTNAYNQIYGAMGNATYNSSWNVYLYELEE